MAQNWSATIKNFEILELGTPVENQYLTCQDFLLPAKNISPYRENYQTHSAEIDKYGASRPKCILFLIPKPRISLKSRSILDVNPNLNVLKEKISNFVYIFEK